MLSINQVQTHLSLPQIFLVSHTTDFQVKLKGMLGLNTDVSDYKASKMNVILAHAKGGPRFPCLRTQET
jgi:hypothetical protein